MYVTKIHLSMCIASYKCHGRVAEIAYCTFNFAEKEISNAPVHQSAGKWQDLLSQFVKMAKERNEVC